MPTSDRLLASNSVSRGSQSPHSFGQLLQQGVVEVNETQQQAASQVHELLTGGDVSQIEVYTAVQKADMAFRLLVQIRNKLMSAYEEINAIRI
jgi:flagellar hook-basal body complex protein FliE